MRSLWFVLFTPLIILSSPLAWSHPFEVSESISLNSGDRSHIDRLLKEENLDPADFELNIQKNFFGIGVTVESDEMICKVESDYKMAKFSGYYLELDCETR